MDIRYYSEKTDESLLDSYRHGDLRARDVLSVRYFNLKDSLCRKAAPNWCDYLDKWTLNECFFKAYLQAEEGYVEGESKFLTYFCSILCHEINTVGGLEYTHRDILRPISLSSTPADSNPDEDPVPIEEVIAASPEADPRIAIGFDSIFDVLGSSARNADAGTRKAIAFFKYKIAFGSLNKAAKALGISLSYAKALNSRFILWARRTLEEENVISSPMVGR
jgi:hypothetical protein